MRWQAAWWGRAMSRSTLEGWRLPLQEERQLCAVCFNGKPGEGGGFHSTATSNLASKDRNFSDLEETHDITHSLLSRFWSHHTDLIQIPRMFFLAPTRCCF